MLTRLVQYFHRPYNARANSIVLFLSAALIMKLYQEFLRNIAIIAHVDHGKTTLVDQMLRQSGTIKRRDEELDRIMAVSYTHLTLPTKA